ncbi:asparagine synthase-related protein [Halomonas sp. KM-1]|uniref:asparagine synthase-related protein n=1 Tax=Halomonas sp. KM-1 TaxID=590061 RepID=UPI000288A606|nr:asparagine synthase-related protein [Halomonas sp. KM-1]
MIGFHTPDTPNTVLQTDLAAENPLYLYWPKDKSILVYSDSITELLANPKVSKPLSVSCEGISFLLQSGVVPPPKTAYEDIYILSIGDAAFVNVFNRKVEVEFTHTFPFFNGSRMSPDEMRPDENYILEVLAEATASRINSSYPSFLFHSAGKDSNTIALALALAGWQDRVTLISHKTNGVADESKISAQIASHLGFKHIVLLEVEQLTAQHKHAIEDYFVHSPFPCTDNVSLAYPLYSVQVPELKEANLIDGGGNDTYMSIPPKERDIKTHKLGRWAANLAGLRNLVKSESILCPLLRTQAEWYGMAGLSLADAQKIYPNSISVFPYWQKESCLRRGWEIYDFKTDILTTVTAAELHIRKVRNFSDAMKGNLVLPFSNFQVAGYFSKMPEKYLFDRESKKNKLILRKILKDRLGLDSDALGKMGYSYDSSSVIINNWDFIVEEIYSCNLWDKIGLKYVINRMHGNMERKGWSGKAAGQFLNRIYLLSAWYNNCQYLRK